MMGVGFVRDFVSRIDDRSFYGFTRGAAVNVHKPLREIHLDAGLGIYRMYS